MMGRDSGRRVVITGMGAIPPLGLSPEEFWQGCVEGRSGVTPITSFDASAYPVRINAAVKGFDPLDYIDRKEARRMARFTQFAVAAARQAIDAAGLQLDKEDTSRIGVVLGNGNGGFPNTQEAGRTLGEKGGMRMDPFYVPTRLPNTGAPT